PLTSVRSVAASGSGRAQHRPDFRARPTVVLAYRHIADARLRANEAARPIRQARAQHVTAGVTLRGLPVELSPCPILLFDRHVRRTGGGKIEAALRRGRVSSPCPKEQSEGD